MVKYEYKCESCFEVVEIYQKMTDPHKNLCPKCCKSTLKRVYSGNGFILKGSWPGKDLK